MLGLVETEALNTVARTLIKKRISDERMLTRRMMEMAPGPGATE